VPKTLDVVAVDVVGPEGGGYPTLTIVVDPDIVIAVDIKI
jgi:hypothetical protein